LELFGMVAILTVSECSWLDVTDNVASIDQATPCELDAPEVVEVEGSGLAKAPDQTATHLYGSFRTPLVG
jgi:hypothetical protein